MTSVLVVDDDASLRNALTRELRANGYDSLQASGYDEALQRLREQTYDVLLTDLRMGEKDGLDLISMLQESFPSTRPILMSAYATARDSERALGLGAVRVLCKPFDSAEMLQAVEKAAECNSGFFGTVHGLSLVDMLQMFHYAQRSVTVRVIGGTAAAVHMQRGQIVHATYGSSQAEEALIQILTMPAGSLETSSLEPVAHSMSGEFQPLMLELLRKLDERGRGVTGSEASPNIVWPFDAFGDGAPLENETPPGPPGADEGPVRTEAGLSSDACQRAIAQLSGDVVCAVVDLEAGSLLGYDASRGNDRSRSEALVAATLALFRTGAAHELGALLASLGGDLTRPEQPIVRLELTLQEGHFIARATRRGRCVVVMLAGRGADAVAARAQLDGVFPLVEALVP
jgi:CheY-like chemotaxis protein